MIDEALITKICGEIEFRFEELSKTEASGEGEPRGNLYHYTTGDGLLGILQTGQVWATNILYLNDTSEMLDARDILSEELLEADIKLPEGAALHLRGGVPVYSDKLPLDHFVISFCEDGDLLGQWRGYGSVESGFSLGFCPATLAAAAARKENNDPGSCTLRRVKYEQVEKVRLIRERINILCEILEPNARQLEPKRDEEYRQLTRLWTQIAASFHPTMALMKNAAFAEEREWRLLRTLWKPAVPTVEWSVNVRMIRGRLSPYLPISWLLPGSSELKGKRGIKEVYCGPSAAAELKQKALQDLLFANKWWNVGVLPSKVPLRA